MSAWFDILGFRHRTILGLTGLLVMLPVAAVWLLRTNGRTRILWGCAAYAGLWAVCRSAKLRQADIGLSRAQLRRGYTPSVVAAIICLIPLLTAFAIRKDLFVDPRYGLPLPKAVFTVLVGMPFNTIMFEELAFRGVLPALLTRLGSARVALLVPAVLFGFWHIPTALGAAGSLRRAGVTSSKPVVVALVVSTTTAAGLVFGYLRQRSGSLLVPVAAHWTINAGSVLLTAFRLRFSGPSSLRADWRM